MTMPRRTLAALALIATSSFATAAESTSPINQTVHPLVPQGVLNLSASASVDVTKDVLSVTLNTTREGTDAATVQAGLKQALDTALAEARKAAKPGQIDVRTGNFSLFPRYSSKGGITGWQGTAELQIQGRDIPGIAQLAGRISSLSIARVGTQLSRELREKVEGEAAAQAIASYRSKAAEQARQFGYSSYSLREVQVGTQEMSLHADGAPRLAMRKADAAASEPLPVELGQGTVSVTVSGSVQMLK